MELARLTAPCRQNVQFIVYIDDEGWPARVIINGLQSLEPGAPTGTYLSMGWTTPGGTSPGPSPHAYVVAKRIETARGLPLQGMPAARW